MCEGAAGQRESILRGGQEVQTGSQQTDICESQGRDGQYAGIIVNIVGRVLNA